MLVERYQPLLDLHSKSNLGHYFYYDVLARANSNFSLCDASGQVRSGSGYLVIWEDYGATKLADAIDWLTDDTAWQYAFPALAIYGSGAPSTPNPRRQRNPSIPKPYHPPLEQLPMLMEFATAGNRQITLFDHLRHWAYKQFKPSDYAQ